MAHPNTLPQIGEMSNTPAAKLASVSGHLTFRYSLNRKPPMPKANVLL